MKEIGFDYENMGGVSVLWAVPRAAVRRVRVSGCVDGVLVYRLELLSRRDVVRMPVVADGTFALTEKKGHAKGGDYWDVDVTGVIPKWDGGTGAVVDVLDRGEWLVVVRDNNGVVRLLGSRGVALRFESERSTGVLPSDRNGVTFHFKGRQPRASLVLGMDVEL